MGVPGNRKPVVHPLAVSSGRDNSGLAQVGEMPGDLRLRSANHFSEVADAYLLFGHQVQQPQPGRISECTEEFVERYCLVLCAGHGTHYIRLDRYVALAYVCIRLYEYDGREKMAANIKEVVKEKYGEAARRVTS